MNMSSQTQKRKLAGFEEKGRILTHSAKEINLSWHKANLLISTNSGKEK